MSHQLLRGPFLTRAQAARRAAVPARLLRDRPDLLVVDSEWLPEVYFAFQFDEHGVQPAVGALVQSLNRIYPDLEIADWLVRPHRLLGMVTPLTYLTGGGEVAQALAAAEAEGPAVDMPGGAIDVPDPTGQLSSPAAAPSKRSRTRRPRMHRPIFHGS